MYSKLLSRIIWACPHQFTWPRREESGAYYQLCVNCGSKYEYDWKKMRRIARVEESTPSTTRPSHRQPKVSWAPRERRHAHVVPVQYRENGRGEWMPGESVNLSRSGVLFRSDQALPEGVSVEVELEMPKELTGDAGSKVTCKATVARVTPVEGDAKGSGAFLIACSIDDYAFEKKAAERVEAELESRKQASKAHVHMFPRVAKK